MLLCDTNWLAFKYWCMSVHHNTSGIFSIPKGQPIGINFAYFVIQFCAIAKKMIKLKKMELEFVTSVNNQCLDGSFT